MADFESLDTAARSAFGSKFGGLSITDAADKSKWDAVWVSAPTQAERDQFASLIAAADINAIPPSTTQRQAIVAAAQSLDGISVTAMTAAQVRTLVALLSYAQGWVKPDGTLRVRG